ncbi:MAG: hypothetical protein N4Q30_03915 [Neisseriaceae bacterium]|nr:hypothetical protein [Neisseriaceae bacterium]
MNYKFGIVAALVCVSAVSYARNDAVYYDFQKHVQAAIQDGSIDGSVKFYLQGAPGNSGTIITKDLVTNKKSSAMTLPEEQRCAYVLKSALIQLHNRAKSEGATKVINIKSFYKKNTYSDPNKYECHVGNTTVGVTLKGDLAK